MHPKLPILLSFLSSTALALPTTTTTSFPTKTLEQRAKAGWVGAFQNSACTGPAAPGSLNLGTGNSDLNPKHCYQWSPVAGTSYIGINYGSQWKQVNEITFFSDSNCKMVNGADASVVQSGDLVGLGCTEANENTKSFKIGSPGA